MGLVDVIKRIKGFFNKKSKVKQTDSKDIANSVIKEYSELSEDEKIRVDNFFKEIDIEELHSLIKYGKELYDKSKMENDLLERLYNELKEKESLSDGVVDETLLINELESLFLEEELILYGKELKSIYDEIELRIIALEKYQKKEIAKKFPFSLLFGRAERIERNVQLRGLESTINDMKVFLRRIEQDLKMSVIFLYPVKMLSNSYNRLNKVQEILNQSNDIESTIHTLLLQYISELIKILEIINSEDAKKLKELVNKEYNEKLWIETIVIYRKKVRIWAYENKKRVEELDLRVSALLEVDKTVDNRESLLKSIDEIECWYNIFREYLSEEQWMMFYELKIKVLSAKNDTEELLLDETKSRKDLIWYQKVISTKLDKILNGENKYFQEQFGDNLNKAIELVKKIIKTEVGDSFNESVLTNRRILDFILAFDCEDGLEKFINRFYFSREYLYYSHQYYRALYGMDAYYIELEENNIFHWGEMLPLKTIYQLEELANVLNKSNKWVKLLSYGNIHHKIEKIEANDNGETIVSLPLGITEIDLGSSALKNDYVKRMKSAFMNANVIILNNDLERIGSFAFENCENLRRIVIPKSVSEIGEGAFSKCKKINELSVSSNDVHLSIHVFDEIPYWQINLIVRGTEITPQTLLRYMNYINVRLKSIKIMDGDVVVADYEVPSFEHCSNIYWDIITKDAFTYIMKKIDEYKNDNGSDKVKVLHLNGD